MRRFILILVCMGAFAFCALSQAPPSNADPILQGTMTYKMPQSAIDADIDGRVMLAIRVDKTGKPKKVSVAGGLMWPCSTFPAKTLDDLVSNLSEEMMGLRFSPATKNSEPIEKDIGLVFMLKNPKLETPPEIDPITGKPIHKTIFGGNLNGKAKYLPKPLYPVEAKVNRDTGSVTIDVLVDEQGKVIRAGAGNGPPILRAGSRESACGAKFTPTLLEGRHVMVLGDLKYNFSIQ
jgi:hypothetical protein